MDFLHGCFGTDFSCSDFCTDFSRFFAWVFYTDFFCADHCTDYYMDLLGCPKPLAGQRQIFTEKIP